MPEGALYFCSAGLKLGGVVLASPLGNALGSHPDRDSTWERDRLEALLAIAFRKAASARTMACLDEAAVHARRGDYALANIRLATAHLAFCPEADAIGYRLALANRLLSDGLTPSALLKAVGLGDPADLARAYSSKQPRNPAGSGRESGRFASESGAPAAQDDPSRRAETPAQDQRPGAGPLRVAGDPPPSPREGTAIAATAVAVDLELGLLAFSLVPASVAALGDLAASIAFAATLGLLFVPVSSSVASTGALPGDDSTRYDYNRDEGLLRLIDTSGPTPLVIAAGHRDDKGVFWDADTDTPFAQEVDGHLVFDAAALAVAASANEKAEKKKALLDLAAAANAKKNGSLCPDVGLDVFHGASIRANLYQAQISWLNNSDRPLPPGLGVALIDPATGHRVVFDDCRDSDGTMIEAKGPGFERFLRNKFMTRVLKGRWAKQASRQVAAADGRPIEWFFAEEKAMNFAKDVFSQNRNTLGIILKHVPAVP